MMRGKAWALGVLICCPEWSYFFHVIMKGKRVLQTLWF